MFGLGFGELLVIGVLALLFIGPKKIPELARSLGKGIREFQKAKDDLMDEIHHGSENRSQSEEQVTKAQNPAEQEDDGPWENSVKDSVGQKNS